MISNLDQNGVFPLKVSSYAKENPQNILNHVRKTQDSLIISHVHNMALKSPQIISTTNKNSAQSEFGISDPIKQIEKIKQKHSQKFKESHFTMERIGLNPSSYSSIVYKKQSNNCIHSIKEYINRSNIGFPQEFTYKQQSKEACQQQQQTNQQQTSQSPIFIESIPSFNKRYKLQNKQQLLKNIEQDEEEYCKQFQEQLREVFSSKKKPNNIQNTVNISQIKSTNESKKQQGTDQIQEIAELLPPRYMKGIYPQKITLKSKIGTGVSTPLNDPKERNFSPPRKVQQNNKISPSRVNQSMLNKGEIVPSISPKETQNNNTVLCQGQLPLSPKIKEKNSDVLFDQILKQKNPLIVEGSIFNKKDNNERKVNKLRYSKDDMSTALNQSANNQQKYLQYLKPSSPLKYKNNFQKNSKGAHFQQIQQPQIGQSYGIQLENKVNLENEQQHLKDNLQKNKTENSSMDQINTNFLRIHTYSKKNKQLNKQKQNLLSNSQFDDSQILNNQSNVKIQQSSVNIPRQDTLLVESFSKNQSRNSQGAIIANSVLLDSMVDYEEQYQEIQQSEIEKQSKANKYLSKLGLNNKYSKKDYLRVQNSTGINQEFLDINFDHEDLIPKQKNNSSLIGATSIQSNYNDDTQNSITYQANNNNNNNFNSHQRSFSTQPHIVSQILQNQQQIGQKVKDHLFLQHGQNQLEYQQQKNQQFQHLEQNYRQKNKSFHLQSQNKDQFILPKVNTSNSPDMSRNMSIIQQCEKERKNLNYLSKKWETNIDKMSKEKSRYNQKFRYFQEQNSVPENSMIFQYYQKQRFNTDL